MLSRWSGDVRSGEGTSAWHEVTDTSMGVADEWIGAEGLIPGADGRAQCFGY